MNTAEIIFSILHGQWCLNRSTTNHEKMHGIASFCSLDDNPFTLFYREEGEYILQDGNFFSFFKEFIYCINQNYIDVYFSSNKKMYHLLHKLTFSESTFCYLATGEYHCNKDVYNATYQFYDSEKFTLQYDIQGPKKNVKIHTLFQRWNNHSGALQRVRSFVTSPT